MSNNSIGLDYSSTHFYVDSNGERCDMPHFYQMQEERINKLKNVLKKCQRGSNNYYKIKDKIGKIYLKTKNQRNDYLHKLSTKIANQYDIVSIEDINMIEMAQTLKLAKNTYDNAYGKFADLLKYKLENQGKVLIKIDRYYPSSKKCHICGFINTNLQIDNRKWICPQCGSVLDRDVNAAINIKERGIEEYRSLGYRDIKPIR